MFSAGFESTIPVIENPQTHTVDRTVTGIVKSLSSTSKKNTFWQTDLLSSSAEREGRGNNLLAYNRKISHWITGYVAECSFLEY